MLLKKQGFPEEGELLLCKVTKVHHHSVFVNLEEYGKSGMIHISEVSPGRIRNLRDFVVEGKIIVCVVLRINKERGYIDLSLRRVSEIQKRNKLNQIKQEQIAEKIIGNIAKQTHKDQKQLYDEITQKVFKEYDLLYSFFEDIRKKEESLEKFVPKECHKLLQQLIEQRIKPPEVKIQGRFEIESYNGQGVEIVKNTLKKAVEAGKQHIKINYIGAGMYSVVIKAEEYKTAESILKKSTEAAVEYAEEQNSTAKFIRDEKK